MKSILATLGIFNANAKENKKITKYFIVKAPEEKSGMKAEFKNLISSYNTMREITKKEMKYMNNAMVAAALRFYLSRLADMIFPKVGEITHIKDPNIFESILLKRIKQK